MLRNMGNLRTRGRKAWLAALAATSLLSPSLAWAAKPTPQMALEISSPVQKDVIFDRPTKEQAEKCKLDTLSGDQGAGWIVRDANGQILRRFVDTNKDTKLDLWCYYRDGIEVYRDIDSNFNGKADQYRWLGTAGSRWGVDENEDGRIESWKVISPEEVTYEVTAALRERDGDRFARLLLTKEELVDLGLSDNQRQALAKKIMAAANSFPELARKQRLVTEKTIWTNFGATQPGVVAATGEEYTKDLLVYENVSAVVEAEGKHAQVAVGTLIQVGRVWRLIDLPASLLDEKLAGHPGGYFFAAAASNPVRPAAGEPSAEMQKLTEELEKIEQLLASATDPAKLSAGNAQRADILEKLYEAAATEEERTTWIRQLADTISSAVQSGGYPEGIERLDKLAAKLQDAPAKTEHRAYVKFRKLLASYSAEVQDPQVDPVKLQDRWTEQLQAFIEEFPQTSDAPDAMLQLALAQEFASKTDDALKWYGRIATDFAGTDVAKKATGAKLRLESVGQVIPLKARTLDGRAVDLAQLRGNLVIIHYWATWCEPCKQDMVKLRDLQAKYAKQRLQIIGVNLDNDPKVASEFLRNARLPWDQAYEPGGLEGRLAVELGIFTLPTMILVGADGKVVNRNLHVGELENELAKRFREERPAQPPRNATPPGKAPTSKLK
jgi:thiol-disulfide isomerase/thioredoxin